MSDQLRQDRLNKLQRIRALGIDPYGRRFPDTVPHDRIRQLAADAALQPGQITDQAVRAAGRIVLQRTFGKLMFLTVRDGSGDLQYGLSRDALAERWDLARLLDLGDIIGVQGRLGTTRTGEITIWADQLEILAKALRPPPEKFHGLQDVELRYRQRYVDLFANPDVRDVFRQRSAIVDAIRRLLIDRGFLEVETPVLQPQYGGAAARPFITHHNALDIDLFLRISPELYLKRLLVGGLERVFEISRNFRNEGISTQHNPEFTMLEAYQAYADYHDMMDLTEAIFAAAVQATGGQWERPFGDHTLDFRPPWPRLRYADLLREHAGVDMDDIPAVRRKAEALGIEHQGLDDPVVVNEVFETCCEPHLIQPCFVLDYPAAICPLTRRHPERPDLALRFETYVAGMELANAYTELNDPRVQEENFRRQLRGEKETMAIMDEDFIAALEYGMPPAGGLGIGIDRLVMVLTGRTSIREVILFPLQRPARHV